MSLLKQKLSARVPALRDEIKALLAAHGETKISEVNVGQAFGGMRGVMGMICDTSQVSPETGLIIRGRPILELTDKWPEEILWLLLTGENPSAEELADLRSELKKREGVPAYVWDVLRAMPADSHPMTMLNSAILVMQKESVFAARYHEMGKNEYWEAALEDALNMLARLPELAAGVYRMRYNKGERIAPDASLDWAANYVHMLGLPESEDSYNMMRLYLTLHSDHEGGNVSAFTCHTVGSALSDPYYAVSAGLNGLAGPLHGLANQECLGFVMQLIERFGGVPTHAQVEEVCWELLNGGHVIPGYGHAVLRAEDPRFTAFYAFGKKHCSDGDVFKTVSVLYETAPEVLKKQGKAKNPWPNVDAGSGALLYHYGLTEFAYYTVLFSVSRAMGLLSQLIINRAIGSPIMRPKSESTEWVKNFVASAASAG
ncbi:citrate (Si)-synthase [bacterium]|nr:citrate (Si)-synthase [bacterium]